MNALEDKAVSRALAKKGGRTHAAGVRRRGRQRTDALMVAKRISYPVMIKAVAGGGGRGMRVAHNDISLVKGFHTARSEAEKAFGNSGVYIEKYIETRTTSNSRSWPITAATSFTWANAIVPFNAATKSWSRKVLPL